MDISKLAREFDIHPGDLEAALDGAARLLQVSRENVRPADKKALRGLADALEQTIDRLSVEAVRERLVEANFEEPDGPDDNGSAYYTAWWAAQARVDRAMNGARDLLAVARAGEGFNLAPGRPQYVDWTAAIRSLLEVWTEDLRREATISGHADDPRGVKLSPLVQFVHRCMELLGEDTTEQTCRTILQNLRNQRVGRSRAAP